MSEDGLIQGAADNGLRRGRPGDNTLIQGPCSTPHSYRRKSFDLTLLRGTCRCFVNPADRPMAVS